MEIKNKKNFQFGADRELIFLILKIDLQMISVPVDYFKYPSLMNFKKEKKKFILLIVYLIHTLCSISILIKMSQKKKQKDRLFVILWLVIR